MLKRSKSDGAGKGPVLVVASNDGACELLARLVESTGRTAVRINDTSDVLRVVAANQDAAGALIDSLGGGINTAMKVLGDIRSNESIAIRDLAVVIVAVSNQNRLFAYQSGADGFVVRPCHARELLGEVERVLSISPEERAEYRRAQLMGGANTG